MYHSFSKAEMMNLEWRCDYSYMPFPRFSERGELLALKKEWRAMRLPLERCTRSLSAIFRDEILVSNQISAQELHLIGVFLVRYGNAVAEENSGVGGFESLSNWTIHALFWFARFQISFTHTRQIDVW